MNARQLEIFHAVMRSGTITGAASFLGISQPAVSKAMRAIERRLGFKLLRPVKGRLYPTPEAQRLLPDADRIMGELSAFERLTGEVKTGGTGLVRVVASSSSATALLPAAAASFQKANPAVRISSHLLPARGVAEAVAAGEADFGLALKPNGTVVGWGYNNYFQTNIPPGLSNVAAVAAGTAHGVALQSNGTAVAWGQLPCRRS